jgi:hypothetical protein
MGRSDGHEGWMMVPLVRSRSIARPGVALTVVRQNYDTDLNLRERDTPSASGSEA